MLIGVNPYLTDPSTTLRACLLGISMFEKTKPICAESNLRKVLVERKLWQKPGSLMRKKQSQFKADIECDEDILLMAQEIATALRASQWFQYLCSFVPLCLCGRESF